MAALGEEEKAMIELQDRMLQGTQAISRVRVLGHLLASVPLGHGRGLGAPRLP